MKKSWIAWILGAAMLMMAGCGSEGSVEGTEDTGSTGTGIWDIALAGGDWEPVSNTYDLNGSDYVTLCDYSAIPVTLTEDYTVSDEDVQAYLEGIFATYTPYGPFHVTDTSKTVIGDGDIVSVDYVGSLDGVAFAGGSAQNQMIDVDNNCSVADISNYYQPSGYIDGFTDGLKGAGVGDVIDCDVTFPENYGNSDLAGKQVVFTFTVNAILKEVNSLDEVDDAFAQEMFEVDTVDEMYDFIREMLEANAEQLKLDETVTGIQQYLLDNCTVEVPKDYLEARYVDYLREFVDQYCGGDVSQLETYVSERYGRSLSEMDEAWREAINRSICIELILDAIADELGTEIDEENYAAFIQQALSEEQLYVEEDLYNLYGYGDAEYGERYFHDIYRYNLVLEELAETVVVK